jgi:hypothetical protein
VSELEQELVSGGDHPTMLKQVNQGEGILHERLTAKPEPTLAMAITLNIHQHRIRICSWSTDTDPGLNFHYNFAKKIKYL